MTGHRFIFLGAIFAAVGVAIGAMGAHALEDWLKAHDPKNSFETAVRYQMYHAVALVLVGLAAGRGSGGLLNAAGWLFVAGIVLFSGGLYGWIFTSVKPFVHIVPVGGTLWIVAWVCFAISQLRR